MLLGERLCHDLYRAMQQGNKVRVSTLRLLSVALKNCEIANGAALEEHAAVEVVIGATKQRRGLSGSLVSMVVKILPNKRKMN